MTTGTVKWFNNFRGYGFITKENGEDIFVHYSAVRMEGFRMLKEGWKVEFMVIPSEKGALASDVEVISTNGDQITEARKRRRCARTRKFRKRLIDPHCPKDHARHHKAHQNAGRRQFGFIDQDLRDHT